MLVLGLTGSIGCGKSSASSMLSKDGISIIDADLVSRQILDDETSLQRVFEAFGESVVNNDKTLNRKALANIVFNDENKLKILNDITHPKIKEKILNKVKYYREINKHIVVIDAPLLIEGGYLEVIDRLLVVTCDEKVQIDRITKRDNSTKEEALARINNQMSQEDKVKYADYVIDNSTSVDELKIKIKEFLIYVKENWCEQ